MHDLPLITTIAAGLTAAWLLGLLTQRLGLSPIVGYLVAGVLIGPHTPGYVGNQEIAHQLAEVGVILLMFGVGLHFQLKDLLAVKSVAVPGALGQSLAATVLAVVVFTALGLPLKTGVMLGMAMSVASTVVLMRVLMDADALNSTPGHVAVGWLIVEDILTVVLLVLIPALGDAVAPGHASSAPAHGGAAMEASSNIWLSLGLALVKLGALVAVVMAVGARVIPWILVRVARLRSRELFTLTVLVFSIAVATGSYYVFGASMALGAFLAGMVVAQSPVSHQAAADALPLRDAFAVLFFVSVGMLFDPAFLLQQPLMILAALGIILVAKPLAALAIVALLGHSVRTALTVAIGLAQIGEFSFILSDLASRHGLMQPAGHSVLVASAILSITLNPLLFRCIPRIEVWLRGRPALWAALNGRAERRALRANQKFAGETAPAREKPAAVVVGFGPVGRAVHGILRDAGLATTVIDFNMDTVAALHAQGDAAIFGDASNESILAQAGVGRATHVVITFPDTADRAATVAAIRSLNPSARVMVRARYLRERESLEQAGATAAVFEEAEAAVALARLVLVDTGTGRAVVERKVRDLRLQLILENMSNIRAQRVRTIMVPWTRVRRLSLAMNSRDVLREIAEHRYSRWPVTEPRNGQVVGYLLAKDLIAEHFEQDWTRQVRPLSAVRSDDDLESVLERLQSAGETLCVVEDGGSPVGLITLEDVLEQVVGRIEDEYPHEARVSLAEAVHAGAIVLDLASRTRDDVIRELAGAIPAARLPAGVGVSELALAREAEVSTDLGLGVAIPHARVPGLSAPLVVFGRSREGIVFSARSSEAVTLVFLLVAPAEQPDVQVTLLARVARIAADRAARERLRRAASPVEVLEVLEASATESSHAPDGAGRP